LDYNELWVVVHFKAELFGFMNWVCEVTRGIKKYCIVSAKGCDVLCLMGFIFSNLLIQRRAQSCRSNVIQFSMQALGSIFHASTKNGTCPVAIHANLCWLGVIFAAHF